MSDEANLKPDLKKLEATLGRLPIPLASINRDELMYQSGWAAALNSLIDKSGGAGSVSRRRPSRTWLWQATALLTSAAAILFGALLMIQSGDAPSSLDRPQVADGPSSMAGQKKVNSSVEIDRGVERESLELANNQDGQTDIVKRLLDFPAGEIMKSGLAFQRIGLAGRQVETEGQDPGSTGLSEIPMSQRKLMEELMPNRRRKTPAWPSLFF